MNIVLVVGLHKYEILLCRCDNTMQPIQQRNRYVSERIDILQAALTNSTPNVYTEPYVHFSLFIPQQHTPHTPTPHPPNTLLLVLYPICCVACILNTLTIVYNLKPESNLCNLSIASRDATCGFCCVPLVGGCQQGVPRPMLESCTLPLLFFMFILTYASWPTPGTLESVLFCTELGRAQHSYNFFCKCLLETMRRTTALFT